MVPLPLRGTLRGSESENMDKSQELPTIGAPGVAWIHHELACFSWVEWF